MCYHYKNNVKHYTYTRSLCFPPKTRRVIRQKSKIFGGCGGGAAPIGPNRSKTGHGGFLLVATLETFIDTTLAGKGGENSKGGVKS